ncbi:uncharacterized protein LOC119987952 [Tripterygium wilfordii]|uniref:uncharacterized protein LOC119987952 n=1 Tax=Tripterygium wilfordii TaxID=458696 RepID=UPI0018F7FF35|nr:uncharacterized protein LOC119987952 [Tripterygium wilfordii]
MLYKTYFVATWVDQYLHLGNTTTNRVESSHSKLKKYLSNSVGGFVQSFNKINLLLQGQVIDIKASFEDSLTRVPIRFRVSFYKELINMVSTTALVKIETELASIGSEGATADKCLHTTAKCYGLPCAHMLTNYRTEGKSIPLSDVHSYWRKLCIQPFSQEATDEIRIDTEIDIVWKTFDLATVPQKLEIKRQLQAIGKASSTSILEPKTKVNLRGRKKGQKGIRTSQVEDKSTKRDPSGFEHALENHVFDDVQPSQTSTQSFKKTAKLKVHRTRKANTQNWVTLFPDFLQPYIVNIVDVPGDGHCGFRVVASFYGWAEDAMADAHNWMIMPYMGNVVSTCYNVVVAIISTEQCLTFFPLRDPMPLDYNQNIMVFGYVNDSHFIRMELGPDSPIPPVSKIWSDNHHPSARGWPDMYASRIEKFKALSVAVAKCPSHNVNVSINFHLIFGVTVKLTCSSSSISSPSKVLTRHSIEGSIVGLCRGCCRGPLSTVLWAHLNQRLGVGLHLLVGEEEGEKNLGLRMDVNSAHPKFLRGKLFVAQHFVLFEVNQPRVILDLQSAPWTCYTR